MLNTTTRAALFLVLERAANRGTGDTEPWFEVPEAQGASAAAHNLSEALDPREGWQAPAYAARRYLYARRNPEGFAAHCL